MATYEEILNRKITHNYEKLKSLDTLIKVINKFVENEGNYRGACSVNSGHIPTYYYLNELGNIIKGQFELDDVKPHVDKIRERYLSKIKKQFYRFKKPTNPIKAVEEKDDFIDD